MALAVESANKVWQRVNAALANASPAAVAQFQALKRTLAQDYRNPDLQFVPITEAQADAAGGTAVMDAACRVIGVYLKKEASATDNWFWLYDDATNDGTAGDALVGLPLLEASKEVMFIAPAGVPAGTGIVVTQYTAGLGTTDGSDGGNGFLILAAA
jgi:hypothetical protein